MRFIRTGVLLTAIVTPVATLVALAGAAPASAAPRSQAGDLYYMSGEYILAVPVAGGAAQRVVKVGPDGASAIAIADGDLFWASFGSSDSSGTVSDIALHGSSRIHVLVGGLSFPDALTAAAGWLYFADEESLGRVRPDGAHLNRRFLVLPQENGGGVAEGLATDGQHIFFSRCQNNEIGRVDLTGRGLDMSYIKLPKAACPQGLAVGNTHVYWTELGSLIGRATLTGHDASIMWLNIHTDEGPFYVAADSAHVYWDWGGVAESPVHIGRASVSGGGADRTFLLGQGPFALTSAGANS